MKKLFVFIAVGLVFFMQFTGALAQDAQSLESVCSAEYAVRIFKAHGFDFVSGHPYSSQRTFQKVTRMGSVTVIMTADEKGKEVKSFSITPSTNQLLEEVKMAVKSAIICLAYTKGAKDSDVIDVKDQGPVSWVTIGKHKITVTTMKVKNGDIVIELY